MGTRVTCYSLEDSASLVMIISPEQHMRELLLPVVYLCHRGLEGFMQFLDAQEPKRNSKRDWL